MLTRVGSWAKRFGGKRSVYMVVAACCVCVLGVGGALAEQARSTVPRIMVLPFDSTSAGDFQYLADSVRAMVASRLAAKPEVEVVEYSLSAADLAALQGEGSESGAVFSRLNVDYLLSGALYALQTGLQIQVNLSGKTEGGGVRDGVFTALAESEGRIIASVEELTDDIAARGLGASTGESAIVAQSQGGGNEGISGFSTEHPEKVFKRGLYSGAIVAEGNMEVESLGVRRSSDLPLTLVSMATADLDGDGTMEIVAASRNTLEVYRFDETIFKKLHVHTFGKTYKIHAVNLADLDGDGRQEIYVSANDYIPASSAIFTWSQSEGFTERLTGIKYYIRPVEIPGDGMVLAGTKSTTNFDDGFVDKNVVKLTVDAETRTVTEGEVIPLPKNVRLFDFVYAQLDGTGGKELVAIDRNEKLLVYDTSNSLLWVSENDYGGSRNFLSIPKSAPLLPTAGVGGDESDDKVMRRPYVYVPIRLVPVDLTGDGREEILVGGNKRVTPKVMINFREYDGGSVVCLSWQETAMVDVWRTNTVTGYLADFTFIPTSTGGADSEMYIAQVPDKWYFGFSFSGDSKLLQYRMNIKPQ